MLEMAIQKITGAESTVRGSGRTDAGAHALAQTVTFSTDSGLTAQQLGRALNAVLPRDIAVSEAADVDPSFNPRHDAIRRTYRYMIWNREVRSPFHEGRAAHVKRRLDVTAMDGALSTLIGSHDYSSFVPVRLEATRRRTIYDARCWREGDLVLVELTGSSFMRQMVRAIVGTLIWVGLGSCTRQEFAEIVRSRDRLRAGDTAPACGLYLHRVEYAIERHTNMPINAAESESSMMTAAGHEERL